VIGDTSGIVGIEKKRKRDKQKFIIYNNGAIRQYPLVSFLLVKEGLQRIIDRPYSRNANARPYP
jgi:hypothetical protein